MAAPIRSTSANPLNNFVVSAAATADAIVSSTSAAAVPTVIASTSDTSVTSVTSAAFVSQPTGSNVFSSFKGEHPPATISTSTLNTAATSTASVAPTVTLASISSSSDPLTQNNTFNILVTGVVPGVVGTVILFLALLFVLRLRRRRKLRQIPQIRHAAWAGREKECIQPNDTARSSASAGNASTAHSHSSASMNSRRWLNVIDDPTPDAAELSTEDKPAELDDRTVRELEAGVRDVPIVYQTRRLTLQSIQELPA